MGHDGQDGARNSRLNDCVNGMPLALPHFDTALLAEAVDGLSAEQLKALPFKAIHLDANGAINLYRGAEQQRSGSRNKGPKRGATNKPAPSVNLQTYRGCIDRALAQSHPDLEFSHVFGLSAGAQDVEVLVRVQPSRDGGRWLFLQRRD